jgi:hypothetical protein
MASATGRRRRGLGGSRLPEQSSTPESIEASDKANRQQRDDDIQPLRYRRCLDAVSRSVGLRDSRGASAEIL